jgi:hypothetical protein
MLMIQSRALNVMVVLATVAFASLSWAQGLAKPELLLKEIVRGMP